MNAAWTAVLVVGLATVAIKAAGPVLAGERQLPERGSRILDLLAPALLAALVATQAFGDDESLVLDERGAGLLAAGVAIVLRAPLLVVILVAAVTVATVLRGLAAWARWSMAIAGCSPSIKSTSGRSIWSKNCRA